MKFIVDTPSGKGILIKSFYRHKKRFVRVKYTNIDPKRKSDVKVFPYEKCKIQKAPSPVSRFLKKGIIKLYKALIMFFRYLFKMNLSKKG